MKVFLYLSEKTNKKFQTKQSYTRCKQTISGKTDSEKKTLTYLNLFHQAKQGKPHVLGHLQVVNSPRLHQ